jgi:hypothetical protein
MKNQIEKHVVAINTTDDTETAQLLLLHLLTRALDDLAPSRFSDTELLLAASHLYASMERNGLGLVVLGDD